jgi:DNA-binding PadR family transcriptional regulator
MSIVEYDHSVSLRIAALGLLAQEPGSGYDLLKHFEKSMANVWPVSDVGPRGRKEYRITEAGRAELRRWITNPQDDPPLRSSGLLRVFLLGEVTQAQARDHVASMARHAEAEVKRLEELRDSIDWSDGDNLFYGRAALEYGLRMNAMEADWARWLVEAIDKKSSKKVTDRT